MRILLFHPVRLPPRDYGGIERVVLWLSEALRDFGHEVTIAAEPGSALPRGVTLLPTPSGAPYPDAVRAEKFDLIHFHSPPGADDPVPLPFVVTIHGNSEGRRFPKNSIFLSGDHARRHGHEAFVYNGANPGEFLLPVRKLQGARPLFLSKTSLKVKNLAGAMRYCKKAGTGLTIAGGYRPLRLLLGSMFMGFDWAGPVSGERKAALLAEASCLVFPVKWPEPFGLVMIESMLSGTPVLASRLGSVPEIVGDSAGKVLDLDDEAGWVHALRDVRGTDPAAVRAAALERFSHWKMAENYIHYYQKAMRGEKIA